MRICVFGAGAIGGNFAARLADTEGVALRRFVVHHPGLDHGIGRHDDAAHDAVQADRLAERPAGVEA